MVFILSAVFSLLTPILSAQEPSVGVPAGGGFNLPATAKSRPTPRGTSLPANCEVGELYFKTDATAGQNVYGCTATDTWTLLGDGGGAGGGITSLGSQTGSTQTFSDVDDTNITLAITSASNNHEFALGWSGTLAKARQNGATVYNDQGNNYTSGAQDFGSAASLKVPSGAGASPTASGLIAYDTTANTLEYGENGTNRALVNTARTLTAGNGLTGGGDLSADRTLDVATTAPIEINSDSVACTTCVTSAAALTSGQLVQGGGGQAASASGFTVQGAGSAGTAVANAGTATSLARSDHEHKIPWQVGAHYETTPAAAESTVPLPVNEACGGAIDATQLSITALTKGSGNLTFNVVRYNSAGTSQGNLFASNQSYSNTGNNRQSFTPDQNNTNLGATDYFRVNFVTVNGQDDLSVAVMGKCKNVN